MELLKQSAQEQNIIKAPPRTKLKPTKTKQKHFVNLKGTFLV